MVQILPIGASQLYDTPISNGTVPKEGPKALSMIAPFDVNNASFTLNLTLTQSQQFMSIIQSLFCDNSANADPVTFTSVELGQQIIIPPLSQAYLPLLFAKNGTLVIASAGQVSVPFILLNVPVAAAVWAV